MAYADQEILFDLLQTPAGQMHRNCDNGMTAVHQAYDIIRRNRFGINSLIGYMNLYPYNLASNLDRAGNTILHAVYQHESRSDAQLVTDAMEQMMSPKEWQDVLAVTNAAGRRPFDVLRSRVHLSASREVQVLLDAWRDSQEGGQNGAASGASLRARHEPQWYLLLWRRPLCLYSSSLISSCQRHFVTRSGMIDVRHAAVCDDSNLWGFKLCRQAQQAELHVCV